MNKKTRVACRAGFLLGKGSGFCVAEGNFFCYFSVQNASCKIKAKLAEKGKGKGKKFVIFSLFMLHGVVTFVTIFG